MELLLIATAAGTREMRVPPGRVAGPDGKTMEFHSELLARLGAHPMAASPVAVALLLKVAGAAAVDRAGRLMAADLEAGAPGWGGGR